MVSAAMRLIWFTTSQCRSLLIGRFFIVAVRRGGGRGLLNPVASLCTSGNRAEVVDLWGVRSCFFLVRTDLFELFVTVQNLFHF